MLSHFRVPKFPSSPRMVMLQRGQRHSWTIYHTGEDLHPVGASSDTVKEVVERVAGEEAGFEVLQTPGRLLEEGSTLRHLGIQGRATLRWCYGVHFTRALNKFWLQLVE